MDEGILKALKGSIAKWEAILAGTGEDDGPDNCPLCQLFNTPQTKDDFCKGCPVREATSQRFCHGTPYEDYLDGGDDEVAQAELDFLKSLLPAPTE